MVMYEIADVKREEIFHSKDCILLRGNKGLVLSYLYDEEKSCHVVEVERYYTQLEVNTSYQTREEALAFMYSFATELPKLNYYREKILTAKHSLVLNLGNEIQGYLHEDQLGVKLEHKKQDDLIEIRLSNSIMSRLEGKNITGLCELELAQYDLESSARMSANTKGVD